MKPLILAVDDCEDDRLLITFRLETMGYRCITAPDAATALQLAQQQPDLIFLDVCMPGMDGLEVIHHLKQNEQTMSIPVVAVTGIAGQEFRNRFLAAGGADYLVKPCSIEQLDRVLRSILNQPLNSVMP